LIRGIAFDQCADIDERDAADQIRALQSDAVLQQCSDLIRGIAFVHIGTLVELDAPPAPALDFAAGAHRELAAAQLPDITKRAQGRGYVLERQIVMNGSKIRGTRHRWMLEQRLR